MAGNTQANRAIPIKRKTNFQKCPFLIQRNTPATKQGKIIPTGPLVKVAHPINRIASQGIPLKSFSYHE